MSLINLHLLDPQPDPPQPRAERIEPQVSDEVLVARLARGDQWAKDALYRRYVRQIWRTALHLVGNSADAEDVVQDTFAEALRDLPKMRQLDALRPWLLRVAVHQAHRCFRRRKALRLMGWDRTVLDAALAALVHPGAAPDVHHELACIDRALAVVSSAERFAWILRYVDGYSLEEAASACNCSLATVKRRIAKATEVVRQHQTPRGSDDG